ncbi:hypothetical protein PENTCL1PPCAC_9866, partial [Pristionchus entomophagus]
NGLAPAVPFYLSIILCIRHYRIRRDNRVFVRGFSEEDLNLLNRIILKSCFIISGSYSAAFYLTDRFFINERRFGYSVERMADLLFTVVDATISSERTEWLTIVAAHRTDNRRSYKFRIRPFLLSKLREITAVEEKCKSIFDQFAERFINYINDNPKSLMRHTTAFDPCFACDTNQPDVVFKKNCIGDSCTDCACRPTW